jgi:hypothetical protein
MRFGMFAQAFLFAEQLLFGDYSKNLVIFEIIG